MRVYNRTTDDENPIAWKDDDEEGTIPATDIGTHSIEGEDVPGTHVEGPFRVRGERKVCESGLLLFDGDKLRSFPIAEQPPATPEDFAKHRAKLDAEGPDITAAG